MYMKDLFKGLHYRSPNVYNFLDFVKLGFDVNRRYTIAAKHIRPGEAVLDVCSGTGALKGFLPSGCSYQTLEASDQFCKILKKKGIPYVCCNLHQGIENIPASEVIVMIISLAQFRKTSAGLLLEHFKNIAKRVIIIEEVLNKPRSEENLYQRTVNYLCAQDYYVPTSWFTGQEFSQLMTSHGYQCQKMTERYWVGTYDQNSLG